MKPENAVLPEEMERNRLKKGMRAKKKDNAPASKMSDSAFTRPAIPTPAINAVPILAHAPYSLEIGGFKISRLSI